MTSSVQAVKQVVLEVTTLSVGYGPSGRQRLVLEDTTFSVCAGELIGIIGCNGAGKSTLLKTVAGLQQWCSGEIQLLGQPLSNYSRNAIARIVACVPQHSASTLSLRAIEMIALGRAPHRGMMSAADDRAIVLDAIERLELTPLAMRYFNELSGGQRQRVLLARALAQQGQLLLLDEPTSDLDLRHQHAALSTVRGLARERGIAAIIAIHDLALAGRYCDRLVLLHGGRVQAQGSWQEVLTAEHLAKAYGVTARVGVDQGMPYVLTQPQSVSLA